MSWDFALHGRILFPVGGLDRWLTRAVEQPSGIEGPLANVVPSVTVQEALSGWSSNDLSLSRDTDALVVRGWVDKDTMNDAGASLLGALLAAGLEGGEGEIVLLGVGEALAYKVVLGDGEGHLSEVEGNLEHDDPRVIEILQGTWRRPLSNAWLRAPVAEGPNDWCFSIREDEAGLRMDKVVQQRFRKMTKHEVKALLASGTMTLDGDPLDPNRPVVAGQRVRVKGFGERWPIPG